MAQNLLSKVYMRNNCYINCDETSGIGRMEFGLGNDRRNVYIQGYRDVPISSHPSLSYRIPDGVPIWVKIRVSDRVDLRDVNHPDSPIIIDVTPPIAGRVFDGPIRDQDSMYQSATSKYCANWNGFSDPESGIAMYCLLLIDNRGIPITKETCVSSRTHNWCQTNLDLVHQQNYFLAVTAINGGLDPRNTTVKSSGVTVDITPPNAGWVHDGLSPESDALFSSSRSTVFVSFGNFNDPESGIDHYNAHVFGRTSTDTKERLIHTEEGIPHVETSLSLHHFNLHHGDTIRTEVEAVNGALESVSVPSTGVIIDVTDPILEAIVDGLDIHRDLMFSSSKNELSVSWIFRDPESGISRYLVSIYRQFQGIRTKIYPESGEFEVPGNDDSVTIEGLQLQTGRHYSFEVIAVNGAELSYVHDTSGVVIDATPPMMDFVHVGVISGQSEEVIDGVVIHNDQENLPAAWSGRDHESGITAFFLALGTYEGGADVIPFHDVGTGFDVILNDLDLQLTGQSEIYHFISMYAVNGARVKSKTITSNRIRIVAGDVTGFTLDGPEMNTDVDYQVDTGTITATFSGFESEAHGIHHYEFCVGTLPNWDDIVPFSSQGLITEDTAGDSRGRLQTLIKLAPGTVFHVTVRAVTGAGNILEAPSNGVTPDVTPPVISITSLAGETVQDQTVYVRTLQPFLASWSIVEEESLVKDQVLSLYNTTGDLLSSTNVSMLSSLPPGMIDVSTQDGIPVFTSIKASNKVLLTSVTIAPEIIVDSGPPEEGALHCPNYLTREDFMSGFECRWFGFSDPHSGISHFSIGMGTQEEDDSLIPFHKLEKDSLAYYISGEELPIDFEGDQVAVTLTAANMAGDSTSIYSWIHIDDSPPVPASISAVSDVVHINNTQGYTNLVQDLSTLCLRSNNELTITWEEYIDSESPIVSYHVALGLTPGGQEIRRLHPVPKGKLWEVFTNIDGHFALYATLVGYNAAGLSATVSSDPIFLSGIRTGQLNPLHIWDGQTPGEDKDIQTTNTGLAATWEYIGDPCPVVKYEWEVRSFNGEIILPMEELPLGRTFGMVDDVVLHDGESFYSIIRATNAVGDVVSARSDGMTVRLEPLVPGNVRDGDIPGTDLMFWTHIDRLSANWDSFGGGEHEVAFYEVAAGNDRRYPTTRQNIHPYVNVGLNQTWTFTDLELLPNVMTYYITVRAHSVTTAVSEITSTGVRIRYDFDKIPGEIQTQRYSMSSDVLEFTWDKFDMGVQVDFYLWGIGNWNSSIEQLHCDKLVHSERSGLSMFDIHGLESSQLDTFVSANDLSLIHGQDYHIVVIAVDSSAECAFTFTKIRVDLTPPERGQVAIGNENHQLKELAYTPSSNFIEVWWSGFVDMESGIERYMISLYQGKSCLFNIEERKSVSAEMELPSNTSSYRFFNLELEGDAAYQVELTVINGASAKLVYNSSPIIVDAVSPEPGVVKLGSSFKENHIYYDSAQELTGSFIYWWDKATTPCVPRRPILTKDYSLQESDVIVDFVNHDQLIDVRIKENMVKIDEGELRLRIERSVREPVMYGGAMNVMLNGYIAGNYLFTLKTGDADFEPVTSISFLEYGSDQLKDFMSNAYQNTSFVPNIYNASFEDQPEMKSGFGIQIHDNNNASFMTIWGMRQNEIFTDSVELSFDATQRFETYKLSITKTMGTIDLEVMVNKEEILSAFGLNALQTSGILQVMGYPRDGHLFPYSDVFHPPGTETTFTSIELPTEDEALCRFGDAFLRNDQPIIVFLAGIGTQRGQTDILEPLQVYEPCVSCVTECDINVCDKDCDSGELQTVTFTLSDLELDPYSPPANDSIDEDLLQSYYLTVWGETGSGRKCIGTSEEIYIDTTPPNITNILHMDANWNMYEPITFQGNNHTIAIYFEANDPESLIVMYEWGIGSTPGGTDLQEFTEIELFENHTVVNDRLEGKLMDKHTYYVTLRAMNGANVWSESISGGVTVWLEEPDTNSVHTEWLHAEPSGTDNLVFLTSQEEVGITWPTPPAEEHIASLYHQIRVEEHENVLPRFFVGFNNSGYIIYANDGVDIKGMDPNGTAYDNFDGHLLLEPGRTLATNLLACNKANLCGNISSEMAIIKRDQDVMSTTTNTRLELSGDNFKVSTNQGQESGTLILVGTLSEDDISKDYMFFTSTTFKPYIVNPFKTMEKTSRILKSRIMRWLGEYLFLTTAPGTRIEGMMYVELTGASKMGYRNSSLDALLGWCPVAGMWVDIERSCPGNSSGNVDFRPTKFTICDMNSVCTEDEASTQGTGMGFEGSVFLALAEVSTEIKNSPPDITSPAKFHMNEDTTLRTQLSASDPDGDSFIFLLHEEHSSGYPGKVFLTMDGLLIFTPNPNYHGNFTLYFMVKEVHTLADLVPLVTPSTIHIIIHPVNDNPVLMLIKEGYNIMEETNSLDIIREQNTAGGDINGTLLFVAYDVDIDDQIDILILPGVNSTSKTSHQIREVILVEQDCSQDWQDRSYTWEKLSSDLWLGRHPVYKPIICNQHPFGLEPGVVWSIIEMSYIVSSMWYGQDKIMAIAEDRELFRSEHLTLKISILEFPCLNGAMCKGPPEDPECQGIERSNGFHENGYTCVCAQDFTGRNCETKIDNCLSDPCPYNYTCTDGVGYHTCSCESIWWPCHDILHGSDGMLPWQLSLAIGIPLIVVLGILIVLFLVSKKKSSNKIGDSTVSLTRSVDFEDLMIPREKSMSSFGSLFREQDNKIYPMANEPEVVEETKTLRMTSHNPEMPGVETPQLVTEVNGCKQEPEAGRTVVCSVGQEETTGQRQPKNTTSGGRYAKSNFDIFNVNN